MAHERVTVSRLVRQLFGENRNLELEGQKDVTVITCHALLTS